jgi:hypothetical protein
MYKMNRHQTPTIGYFHKAEKAKMSLRLTKHHAMKEYWGVEI